MLTTRYTLGFTLLELVVALTLASLIMLMLAVGMNTVLNEWTRSRNHLDENLDKILILLQIERALMGAFPHTYLDQDENKKYIFFEGEEEQLAWVSTVSPGRQPSLMTWQLLPNQDDTGVKVRLVPAFVNDPTERLEKEATVVTALEGYKVSFEYLYVDEKIEQDTKWLKEWSAKKLQSLPYAVRMRLEGQADLSEQTMEIVAFIPAREHQTIRPLKP